MDYEKNKIKYHVLRSAGKPVGLLKGLINSPLSVHICSHVVIANHSHSKLKHNQHSENICRLEIGKELVTKQIKEISIS